MSYFAPYIDGSGLHIPSYNDILEDMIASMKQIYGADIYLGNDSADYQMLSIFALKTYDALQALTYAYNSRSPATAFGATLDTVVKLNGIKRKAAGHSTCQVVVTGTPFTQIVAGKVTDDNGLIWDLPTPIIIGSDGTLTTTVTCEVPGAVIALAGEITNINTPTYGWESVRNDESAVPGNEEETDAELRARQEISTSNPSQTMLAGTKGAIAALEDVRRYAVYENDTNVETVTENNPYGLPAHSVTCVVEGGRERDIAEAIYIHKGIGCYTNGDIEVEYTDQNDYINRIRFSRPVYKDIHVSVTVKKYTGYIATMMADVQSAVYTYLSNLTIGSDVSISVIAAVITNCNPDMKKPIFGIADLKIGLSSDSLAAHDIVINYNEIPRPSYDNIEVHVE